MAWRKWFVRGLVFGVVGVCVGAASVYHQWTNPAAVREQVLHKLEQVFPGAAVSIDSAHLHPFGGIRVRELRLRRRDDGQNVDIAQIPSAVIHHDKEKVLEGDLLLRKVELLRPRIRIYRTPEGKWSFAGLGSGRQKLDVAVPTVVVRQGTLLLEDRDATGAVSTLEIEDVHLLLVNDPLPTLQFEGKARSALLGSITLAGTIRRATGEVELTAKTTDTILSQKLTQRLGPWCTTGAIEQTVVSGRADLELRLRLLPEQRQPAFIEATCRLRDVSLKHPKLPMPLEKASATIRIENDRIALEAFEARSGEASVSGKAKGLLPCLEKTFEAEIEIQKLPVTDELVATLPKAVRELHALFQPSGETGVKLAVARRDGEWTALESGREASVTLLPDGARSVMRTFPYPLTDVRGTIDYALCAKRATFRIEAQASGRPFAIAGSATGTGRNLDVSAELFATGVPVDETLLSALPKSEQALVRSFRPNGAIDVAGAIRHVPGAEKFENRFRIAFRDASVAWDAFPLPMKNVSGRIDLYPRHAEFHGIRGEQGAGKIEVQGSTSPRTAEGAVGLTLQIRGERVTLGPELEAALGPMPALKATWKALRPSGEMNFLAHVHRTLEDLRDLDVWVQVEGATVTPEAFPYRLADLRGVGQFREGTLRLAQVSARHGTSKWTLPAGQIVVKPGGGFHAELPAVDVDQLAIDADILNAAPEPLRQFGESLQLSRPIRAVSRFVVEVSEPGARPDIYWDLNAYLRDVDLRLGVALEGVTGVLSCRGRHNGARVFSLRGNALLEQATAFKQTTRDLQTNFWIDEATPDTLSGTLFAPVYGGSVGGEYRIDFGSQLRYELNLTISQVDLQQLGRKNLGEKSRIEGKGVGRLHLTGSSAGVETLDGNGSFDVWNGRLYDLPLILDLIKFLGLRWPDRTAFEEVHAAFRVQGTRVTMKRLELQGNAVSLTGQGSFALDGSDIHLDFFPTWARVDQLLPPALKNFPPAVSKNLLVIEMRGKVGPNPNDLKFVKRPLPLVVDPFKAIQNRFRGAPPTPETPPAFRTPELLPDPLAVAAPARIK